MAWHAPVTVEPFQSLEITLAMFQARAVKGMVLTLDGTVRGKDQRMTGTGFAWSDGLNANYAYVPGGAPRTQSLLTMTFSQVVTDLSFQLLTWPARQPLGPEACGGILLTVMDPLSMSPIRPLTCEWTA
ncbi:MAG: hypothetical protein ABIS84_07060 [Arachnia sp.]